METDTYDVRDSVVAFGTYEEYLDSQVTDTDRAFLEDDDIAR